MSKYGVGDKVVIRKDLIDGVEYGDIKWWSEQMEYFKEKDYVVIERIDSRGNYRVEDSFWTITDEMIDDLYVENVVNNKTTYKIGDKVVIRKDLKVDNYYGGVQWWFEMERLESKDYVVIEEVDDYYWIEDGYWISEEMIAGLYDKENSVNVKPEYGVGDKVVIRKDLLDFNFYGEVIWLKGMDYMKEKDYVVIKRVDINCNYWIDDSWCISDEMIEGLYEEDEEKYSDPTLVEIITHSLNKLENAYDNKKFIPITTTDLLVLQRLLNDAGFDYKFKEIMKINTK